MSSPHIDVKSDDKHVDTEKGISKELVDIVDIDDPVFRREAEEGVDQAYVLKAELSGCFSFIEILCV